MGRVQCGLDVWNVEEKDGLRGLWLQEAVEEVHSALLGPGQAQVAVGDGCICRVAVDDGGVCRVAGAAHHRWFHFRP